MRPSRRPRVRATTTTARRTMQGVTWDSQQRMTDAANAGDIVNLKADFSFGGATVTTDFGGGVALGGWAVEVTKPNADGDMEAVEDGPEALGADGTASFSEVVSADDLPVTYTVAVAEDQANTPDGDGGEEYEATELTHAHDGLSLPATVELADMLEVTYTTQTLKVYVYEERDQVDELHRKRPGRRHEDVWHDRCRHPLHRPPTDALKLSRRTPGQNDGRLGRRCDLHRTCRRTARSSLPAEEFSKAGPPGMTSRNSTTSRTSSDISSDELDAYTDNASNGRMGGAFGDNGGYSHTVELCPLMSDEGDQRHGDCGTFAYVQTYAVIGQVWENTVAMDRTGGFTRIRITRRSRRRMDGRHGRLGSGHWGEPRR